MRRHIWTNGCFDGGILPHHVFFLEKCRLYGETLIIGLNTDKSVRDLKGPMRPIISFDQRREALEALCCVDLVVPMDENEPSSWIKQLRPHVVVKGYPKGEHQRWNRQNMPEWDVCHLLGIPVMFVEGPAMSTTQVQERLANV